MIDQYTDKVDMIKMMGIVKELNVERKNRFLYFLKIFMIGCIVGCLVIGCNNATPHENPYTEEELELANRQEEELKKENKNQQPDDVTGSSLGVQENTSASESLEVVELTTAPDAEKEIVLSFTGDVYLSDKLIQSFSQKGIAGVMDASIEEALKTADFTMINHEYACTNETQMVDYQIYNFKSAPKHEYILKELGVDIAGLANNHILDYGVAGMRETIKTLEEQEIAHVGAGNNVEEAKQAVIKEVNGMKIAFLAASHFVPSTTWHADDTTPGIMTMYETTANYDIFVNYMKELKEQQKCDLVILFVHYGVEKQEMFVEYQQKISRAWIEAGADCVIGSHAHQLQGIEIYNGKYIFYNLGNFLFSSYARDTVVLQLQIDVQKNIRAKLVPCVTQNYYVKSKTTEEAQTLYRYLERISVNAQIDAQGYITMK